MGIESYLCIGKPEEKKEICVERYEDKVIFEPKAVYEGIEKKLYAFDESLQALRKRGYDHHPRPAEVFDLICRSLEGRLQPEQQAVVDNMLNCSGEWMSLAIRKKGNKLHCYFDPENLVRNGKSFFAGKHFKCSLEKVYDIQSLSGFVFIKEINKVSPELVEVLWSRPYAVLPEKIRTNARLYLSQDENIWPVGCGNSDSYIYCGSCYYRASRGVQRNAEKHFLYKKSDDFFVRRWAQKFSNPTLTVE